MTSPYLDANRAGWNERADIHVKDSSGFYGIERLLAGANLLTPIERSELGDLGGRRIAHFQCHIGTDSLSLLRQGASEVVGLDFSPIALGHARDLASRTGLNARFVEGSVYDAPALLGSGFDMVFTSWGTIVWLDNLTAWAMAIAGVLRPGGTLYFCDTHPFAAIFEDGLPSGGIAPRYDFQTDAAEPIVFESESSYNESSDKLVNTTSFEWIHPVSRVLNALIGAGLRLDKVTEHDTIPWRMFEFLDRGEDRLYRLPAGHVRMPLSWSIRASKR